MFIVPFNVVERLQDELIPISTYFTAINSSFLTSHPFFFFQMRQTSSLSCYQKSAVSPMSENVALLIERKAAYLGLFLETEKM